LKRTRQIALLALLMLTVCLIVCHRNHGVQPQPVPQTRNLPVITVSVGAPVEYTTVARAKQAGDLTVPGGPKLPPKLPGVPVFGLFGFLGALIGARSLLISISRNEAKNEPVRCF